MENLIQIWKWIKKSSQNSKKFLKNFHLISNLLFPLLRYHNSRMINHDFTSGQSLQIYEDHSVLRWAFLSKHPTFSDVNISLAFFLTHSTLSHVYIVWSQSNHRIAATTLAHPPTWNPLRCIFMWWTKIWTKRRFMRKIPRYMKSQNLKGTLKMKVKMSALQKVYHLIARV